MKKAPLVLCSVPTLKERKQADVLVLPFWHGEKKLDGLFKELGLDPRLEFPLKSGDFEGKEGELLFLYPSEGKEKRVLFVGLGNKEKGVPDAVRRAYGFALKGISGKKLGSANFFIPETESIGREMVCRAVFEGVLLSHYTFDYKSERKEKSCFMEGCFCGLTEKEDALLKNTEVVISSTNMARDLVNGNADEVNQKRLILVARELEEKNSSITVTVLDEKKIEKEKMGLLLAVGRGASIPPAVVLIEYTGNLKSKEKIALVGKGIVYDTGGLNLKPIGGMETMKCDMSGAAAVLGAIQGAAELKLPVNLVGALAIAENAIGPLSYKPGDVYKSRSGKTVEITNTDAEGRLVLADVISYVQDKYPLKCVIDIATLTGAIVIALGEEASGLFSNDDLLAKALTEAGERTHERVWRLPLYPEYKDLLKSSIADIKNAGPRKAGSSTAAIFIEQFIEKKLPWAHLDIAGTAYLSELKSYHPTPATGVGVRLLLDFLEHFS